MNHPIIYQRTLSQIDASLSCIAIILCVFGVLFIINMLRRGVKYEGDNYRQSLSADKLKVMREIAASFNGLLDLEKSRHVTGSNSAVTCESHSATAMSGSTTITGPPIDSVKDRVPRYSLDLTAEELKVYKLFGVEYHPVMLQDKKGDMRTVNVRSDVSLDEVRAAILAM